MNKQKNLILFLNVVSWKTDTYYIVYDGNIWHINKHDAPFYISLYQEFVAQQTQHHCMLWVGRRKQQAEHLYNFFSGSDLPTNPPLYSNQNTSNRLCGYFHYKPTTDPHHHQLPWHFTPPIITWRAWNQKPYFSTLKIFEWAVKKPLRNTPHPTATNPVQTNQVVQKSFAQDDRGGLHADTVGEPSFHVLGWLTSNFWHIHYIPACRLQTALKWWQLQDSQRGIWPFWQQVAFHL